MSPCVGWIMSAVEPREELLVEVLTGSAKSSSWPEMGNTRFQRKEEPRRRRAGKPNG